MKSILETGSFVVAAILPVFLIIKWRHWGLIASILFGWALVFVVSVAFPFHDKVDAVFAGLWGALGWLYMLAWGLPIYLIVLISSWIKRKRRKHEGCA